MKLFKCLVIITAILLLSACAAESEYPEAAPAMESEYLAETVEAVEDSANLHYEALTGDSDDSEDYDLTDIIESDVSDEITTDDYAEAYAEYSPESPTEHTPVPLPEALPEPPIEHLPEPGPQEPNEPTQQAPTKPQPQEEPPASDYQDMAEEPPAEETTEQTGPFVGFTIRAGGVTHTMSFDDFLALSPQAFSAYPRDVQRNFTGLPIATIFRHFGINHAQSASISVFSYDGFGTGVSMAEAMDAQNAFIAIAEDGVRFYGRGGNWNRAPFMLVMADDPFPNRFARYITEIVLQ